MMDILLKLQSAGGRAVKENEPLAKYTTFKIGGPAKYFCVIKSIDKLLALFNLAKKEKLPVFILGGGSNVLASDVGFNGLVIKPKIGAARCFLNLKEIKCGAGVNLSKVVKIAAGGGLSGLEWAIGIPGTIGGAIRGNAGAYGVEMKDSVKEVAALSQGKIKIFKNKDCRFAYRQSIFKNKNSRDIIISAVLKLKKRDKKEINKKIKEILAKRKNKFDHCPSAGSIFKNIQLSKGEIKKFKSRFPELPEEFVNYQKIPAAWLIDQCGLKGRKIGGAMVSKRHAGIIYNAGQATAQDVAILISIIKQKVRAKFNLQLMEEIEYIGF